MKLDNVYSIYNKGILKNIDFNFEVGKMYYVVVENEKIGNHIFEILGLIAPLTGGTFTLQDKDTSKLNHIEIAKLRKDNIGLIFREMLFDEDLKVKENILLTLNNKLDYTDINRVDELLSEYNLNIYSNKLLKDLPIYDRQKLSLVRAIINNPKFVIANEPTYSLNQRDIQNYYNLLKDLTNKGIGVIVITRMVLCKDYANKIYWYTNNLM